MFNNQFKELINLDLKYPDAVYLQSWHFIWNIIHASADHHVVDAGLCCLILCWISETLLKRCSSVPSLTQLSTSEKDAMLVYQFSLDNDLRRHFVLAMLNNSSSIQHYIIYQFSAHAGVCKQRTVFIYELTEVSWTPGFLCKRSPEMFQNQFICRHFNKKGSLVLSYY